MRKLIPVILCFCIGLGCKEDNPGFVPDPQLPGECRAGEEVVEVFEDFEISKGYDILFVVDNSGDSRELQAVLAEAVPAFLSQFEDAGKDVAVAVATTDPTEVGLAKPGQLGEGCAGNDTVVAKSQEKDQWKEIVACNVVQENTADSPDAVFTTIQKVVLAGSSIDFWRDNARKLVVVVSRDDDCSATVAIEGPMPREACAESGDLTPVSSFVEFVEATATTPEGLQIAFVGGPASSPDDPGRLRPVCNSRIGPVYGGNRFQEAADGLGDRSLVANVCSEDLTPTLQSIANTVLERGTTFCTARPMAHEPLRVVGSKDGDDADVRVGDGGFVYLGTQPECENGALVFDDDELESIAVSYCAL